MLRAKSLSIIAPAIVALTIGACSYIQSDADAVATQAASAQTIVAEAGDLVSSGTFEGRSDHITTGGVSLVSTEDGYQLVFADDFSLDGAPDPVVGFGKAGAYDTASQVSALANKTGAQSYSLPVSFTPDAYDEVYVWCEQFSVPLGVATLETAE
ncbi:MAG: DM13 domain-containing protein [Pseudomonadota bacterium]